MSWEETEKNAILLDREAVLIVVSALRKYRAAAKELLSQPYYDYSTRVFAQEVHEIEE